MLGATKLTIVIFQSQQYFIVILMIENQLLRGLIAYLT